MTNCRHFSTRILIFFGSIKKIVLKIWNLGTTGGAGDIAKSMFQRIHWPLTMRTLRLWQDPTAYLPLLAKCGREAYIGQRKEVSVMSQMLSSILLKNGKSTKKVSVSTESFSKVGPSWLLEYVPVPSTHIFMRVHMLWQSRLMDLWNGWSVRIETWNASRDNAKQSYLARLPKR